MTQEIPFGFNTPESPKDYRDIPLTDIAMAIPTPDEYFVDISKIPVTMQYKRGSCVAHATAKRKEKVEQNDTGVLVQLSPRFLYSIIKKEDGNSEEGTAIRNGLKLLRSTGVCTESTYPSDYKDMSHADFMDYSKIPPQAFEEAKNYKDQGYAYVAPEKDVLKQAIMQGDGVIARTIMSRNWWTAKDGRVTWAESDLMPLRPHDANSPATGGHAVWLYGFKGDRFYGRNSWSAQWGAKGDFYFDWDDYKSAITEAWVSTDIDNDKLEEVHNLPKPQPITRYLVLGTWGDDVKRLQKVLGVTPVSGWFGPITLKAVMDFQKKYGITQTGTVGPITRAKLAELYFS